MIALFGLALIAVAAVLWRLNISGGSLNLGDFSDVPLTNPPSNTLVGAIFSQDDIDAIFRYANYYDIDARFLGAIRKAENGGPGREFGILSVPAPDLDSQARVAAQTVKNNLTRFENQTGLSPFDSTGRYSDAFVEFLGARYAPVGAGNDPLGLNTYWVGNVESYYRSIDYA